MPIRSFAPPLDPDIRNWSAKSSLRQPDPPRWSLGSRNRGSPGNVVSNPFSNDLLTLSGSMTLQSGLIAPATNRGRCLSGCTMDPGWGCRLAKEREAPIESLRTKTNSPNYWHRLKRRGPDPMRNRGGFQAPIRCAFCSAAARRPERYSNANLDWLWTYSIPAGLPFSRAGWQNSQFT
jgi:hypothetical protein